MRTTRTLLAAVVLCVALEGTAAAQAMFTASIGNVFGGDAPAKRSTWAVAIGGGGSHGIGSELEFSRVASGRVVTLMPSVFVTVPVDRISPYAIFGFGFIRQRTEESVGGLFSNLSDDDIGYGIGGGVTYKFARYAGLRADVRHFKVRTSSGLSFRRILVGLVLGG